MVVGILSIDSDAVGIPSLRKSRWRTENDSSSPFSAISKELMCRDHSDETNGSAGIGVA